MRCVCHVWCCPVTGCLSGFQCFGLELTRRVTPCSTGRGSNTSIAVSHNVNANSLSILRPVSNDIHLCWATQPSISDMPMTLAQQSIPPDVDFESAKSTAKSTSWANSLFSFSLKDSPFPGAKSVFKNVTAGQDETYADANKASSGAVEIRDRWVKERCKPFVFESVRSRFGRPCQTMCFAMVQG